ncbi:MAG: hypothetical protein WBI17_12095 [Clostridiaceae bacterium]
MFDEKYKSLFQKIQVSDELKEKTKENMQKELNQMERKQGKYKSSNQSIFKYGAVAATLLLVSVVAFKLLDGERGKGPIAGGLIPETAVETPIKEETTVLYSHLNFADTTKIEAPVATKGMDIKIAAFTEDIIGQSNAVIKGTVTNIRFKEYKFTIGSESGDTQATRESVIYEVKVDKIYYSTLSFKEGDTIIIENDLYTYTSLASSVEKLNTSRDYILMLHQNEGEVYNPADTEKMDDTIKLESNLSILYPFTPQIEITKDGQYLFPDHWVNLVNDKTKTVTMDTSEELGYYGEMKLRDDTEFEADFQKIVDLYCK